MPGRGQYWKIGGLNDGVVKSEDLTSDVQTQLSPSFLLASSSAGQNVGQNTAINIDSVDFQRGTNIELNIVSHQFTLKANKTYKLIGNGTFIGGGAIVNADLVWFDVTNAVRIGPVVGHLTADANGSGSGKLIAIIKPTIDILVEFRMGNSVSGTLGFFGAGREILPQVLIEEI